MCSDDAIHACLAVYDTYERGSGSKLNLSKSKGLWLGPWANLSDPPVALEWLSVKIKVLGVFLGPGNLDDDNWKPRIAAVENTLSSWRQRILSFQGRALVINTLVLSQVWYVASLIHMPPWVLGKLLRLVFSFFWKGKMDLVAPTGCSGPLSRWILGGGCKVKGSVFVGSVGKTVCHASGFTLSLTPLQWRCFLGPLFLAPVLSLRFISRYCWPGVLSMVLSLGRERPW